MTATSSASIALTLPDTCAACSSVAPKAPNKTFVSERFIALAIRSVSSEPAAPTMTPAMIIA
jgi:hypothetical protein